MSDLLTYSPIGLLHLILLKTSDITERKQCQICRYIAPLDCCTWYDETSDITERKQCHDCRHKAPLDHVSSVNF